MKIIIKVNLFIIVFLLFSLFIVNVIVFFLFMKMIVNMEVYLVLKNVNVMLKKYFIFEFLILDKNFLNFYMFIYFFIWIVGLDFKVID